MTYIMDKTVLGKTPNLVVLSNKFIKFGCFEESAGYCFNRTITRHYATIHYIDDRVWLGTAKDLVKDQTDFLSQINYCHLSKLMFSIDHLPKREVRKFAVGTILPSTHRRDSQGVCFLGKIKY
jgi:tRNA-specific 2-thiouridylase